MIPWPIQENNIWYKKFSYEDEKFALFGIELYDHGHVYHKSITVQVYNDDLVMLDRMHDIIRNNHRIHFNRTSRSWYGQNLDILSAAFRHPMPNSGNLDFLVTITSEAFADQLNKRRAAHGRISPSLSRHESIIGVSSSSTNAPTLPILNLRGTVGSATQSAPSQTPPDSRSTTVTMARFMKSEEVIIQDSPAVAISMPGSASSTVIYSSDSRIN